MANIQKTLAFTETQIKFSSDGKVGVFEGYASVFDVIDSDGDIILPGAFKKALSSQSRQVGMFFNHQTYGLPVGKWQSLAEDSKGLFVGGELTPGLSVSNDLRAAMEHKTVEGLSVGFTVLKDDYAVIDTGRAFSNVQALREISICTFPANEQATIDAMKSMESISTIRDVEHWLRDSAGLSKSQALGLIARIKSAVRSDSEGGEITAILDRIKSFPSVGN
ncbi:HK97 family phage prohead protease [Pseudomonas sp. MAFF 730085]|jgi:HK97 family phage prohead protease|uniref:HK97 family phage prohead protease n=1 Tax=Pseudomonas kitaguniensis TaxID=2607908 RepID=A0A5N7JR58_9PSED|nr:MULTISPECIES: HK97 family phage prohead protease [Pseudomonas]MPQ83805.1 HK97 family phage prohead protease [Pseudomonas kitaguniensis]